MVRFRFSADTQSPYEDSLADQGPSGLHNTTSVSNRSIEIYRQGLAETELTLITCGTGHPDRVSVPLTPHILRPPLTFAHEIH